MAPLRQTTSWPNVAAGAKNNKKKGTKSWRQSWWIEKDFRPARTEASLSVLTRKKREKRRENTTICHFRFSPLQPICIPRQPRPPHLSWLVVWIMRPAHLLWITSPSCVTRATAQEASKGGAVGWPRAHSIGRAVCWSALYAALAGSARGLPVCAGDCCVMQRVRVYENIFKSVCPAAALP